MSQLVVGSVALDTVETPLGSVQDALGGSAIYFSASASYFAPVNLVAVVGEDFRKAQLDFMTSRKVDLAGLEVRPGKTFRWGGRYGNNFNDRETLFTHLNVFEDFKPAIPEAYRDSQFIFLANIAPELQLEVLAQIRSPKLVALDTMNYWIDGSFSGLLDVLKKVDVLIINDSEAQQLAEEPNLIKAAKRIRDMGPDVIVIKKGEHGALLFGKEGIFWAPAFLMEEIDDPTGAGDTFAGGFMGYLAHSGTLSHESFKSALVFGSVMASFAVEKFSLERLMHLGRDEIRTRVKDFWHMTNFDHANSDF